MFRFVLPTVALLIGATAFQPATAESAADLVKQAVAAQGGADALRALKTIEIKGDAKFWEPGQSKEPGGESRFLGDATFVTTGDFANHMARVAWDRDQKYPEPAKMKYTETFTRTAGFVTDEKGSQPMSGIRLAAQMREIVRASPTLMLYALENPKDVADIGTQKMGRKSMPAIVLKLGQYQYTVLFDKKSHLPAVVRTRDDDNHFGDSNYDLVLSDWKAVGGVQIAHSLTGKVNDADVMKLTYTSVTANPKVDAASFAVPDAIKDKVKPAATANVPYQWVIRRIFLTRFLDSDAVIAPTPSSMKLVELAPNVQHVEGGTANNLIVAMKDYLIVFDAPYGEQNSKWTIDAAKAKYPGKPIKYLVLSHHHMDHSGGLRTYVAEGATLVMPAPDKKYFAKVLKRPHTVAPDAQQAAHKRVRIEEVADTRTFKDDTAEVRVYNIPNPHVEGMLIGHVVASNVVYVTDLVSPRGKIERTGGTAAVGEALRKANITGATIAGGHGTLAKQADIGEALAAK